MDPVLSPHAMGEADRRTIAAGTPEPVLVERAGRAVAWVLRKVAGGCYGRQVLVVCGKGNNGADGRVAARVLRRWGMGVTTFAVGELDRSAFARALRTSTFAVDAMYGTGLRDGLEGDAAWVAEALASWPGTTIAVDIPSGVDGATGEVDGIAVRAQHTVTFAARKPGLLFEPGRSHAGQVVVADIGIDLGPDASPPPVGLVQREDAQVGVVPRPRVAHKWWAAVGVVGGSPGMAGAPVLTSRAAMRAGSGMVWCWLPEALAATAAPSASELIVHQLPGDAAAAAARVLERVDRFKALAIGPGLGPDPAARAVALELVSAARLPIVLDADGLNALDGDVARLRERPAPTILTPHDGEYARLVGAPVGRDRIDAARRLAGESGAVVLLKGPGTVVADPDGRAGIVTTGGPWLAAAGTGDVLTGVVAALVARGAAPFVATCAAAWLHGRAADGAARRLGPSGMIAGDLLRTLPRSLRELEARDSGGSPARHHSNRGAPNGDHPDRA